MTLAEIANAGRSAAQVATALVNAEHSETIPLRRDDLEAITQILTALRAEVGGFRTGETAGR